MEAWQGQATLVLARVPAAHTATSHSPPYTKLAAARRHPARAGLVTVLDEQGILSEVYPGNSPSESRVVAQYELLVNRPGDEGPQCLRKPWSDYAMYDDGLVFSHHGSSKLLFVQVPLAEGDYCGVFHFGSHTGEVRSMITSGSSLLSGSIDGTVKLWNLEDGTLLDSKAEPQPSSISALEQIGPLMVASGNSAGYVTVYDVSTRTLMPVQRFFVDQGPVTHLAARVMPHQLKAASTTSGPRAADGGGMVHAPVGLPWRCAPYSIDAPIQALTDTLLAAASTAGWLHVYQACLPGEQAWQRQYSGVHGGKARLAFSPEGGYLALGADDGTDSSTVLLDTHTWAVARQWPLPSMLADLLWVSSELGVFSETLSPAIKLALCVCPQHQLPQILQAKLPLKDATAQQTEQKHRPGQDMPADPTLHGFLDGIAHSTTLPTDYRSPLWPFDPALHPAPNRSTRTALLHVASQQQALTQIASPTNSPHSSDQCGLEHGGLSASGSQLSGIEAVGLKPSARNLSGLHTYEQGVRDPVHAARTLKPDLEPTGSLTPRHSPSKLPAYPSSPSHRYAPALPAHGASQPPMDRSDLNADSGQPVLSGGQSNRPIGNDILGSPSRPPLRPPATLPAVRSWLTGQAPNIDLDSIVAEMLGAGQGIQQQQQHHHHPSNAADSHLRDLTHLLGPKGAKATELAGGQELLGTSTFQTAAPPSAHSSASARLATDVTFDQGQAAHLTPPPRTSPVPHTQTTDLTRGSDFANDLAPAAHPTAHLHAFQSLHTFALSPSNTASFEANFRPTLRFGMAEVEQQRLGQAKEDGAEKGASQEQGQGPLLESGASSKQQGHYDEAEEDADEAPQPRALPSHFTSSPARGPYPAEPGSATSPTQGPHTQLSHTPTSPAQGSYRASSGSSVPQALNPSDTMGVAVGSSSLNVPASESAAASDALKGTSVLLDGAQGSSVQQGQAGLQSTGLLPPPKMTGVEAEGHEHDLSGDDLAAMKVQAGQDQLQASKQAAGGIDQQQRQASKEGKSECGAEGGGDVGGSTRDHGFNRAAYFGEGLWEGSLSGNVFGNTSSEPQLGGGNGGFHTSDTHNNEGHEGSAAWGDGDGSGDERHGDLGQDWQDAEAEQEGSGKEAKQGSASREGAEAGDEQSDPQPLVEQKGWGGVLAASPGRDSRPPPDFISRVPSALSSSSKQSHTPPKPKLSASPKQRDVVGDRGANRDQRSVAPALPYALRAPRARADLHHRMQVQEGAGQTPGGVADAAVQHAQGLPAKQGTEAGRVGIDTAQPHTSSRGFRYRGYKPNMAVLLKEIRGRGSPAKQLPNREGPLQQQKEQQGEEEEVLRQQQQYDHEQRQQGRDQQQQEEEQQQYELRRQPQVRSIITPHKFPSSAWQDEEPGCDSHEDDANGPQRNPNVRMHGQQPDVSEEPSMQASSVLLGSPASGMTRVHTEGDMPPLQRPTLLSTAHLLRRMEALSMAEAPSGPALLPVEHEEIARRAATLASNIPLHVHLYGSLQHVEAQPQPVKVQKQLHPGWVASRQNKPDMRSLWKQEEQQPEVCNTRGVALYTRPSAHAIASQTCDF